MAEYDPREFVPVAPEFFVRDVAENIRFFVERLGFEVERDESPTFAVVRRGEAIVMFVTDRIYPGPREDLERRGVGVEIRFIVPDVDAVYKDVREAGVTIARPIQDQEYGLRDFVIHDPNGFRLRFASPL